MAHDVKLLSASYLKERITVHKRDPSKGLFSVCSSHPFVLDCVIKFGIKKHTPILIETTCNQVNQYSGYTGFTPGQFSNQLLKWIGSTDGQPPAVLLGGDHLGPFPWRDRSADDALKEAICLVTDYVKAGYQKIHLDASMALGGEDLSQDSRNEVIAERTALLCQAAESAAEEVTEAPVYVIGSEVPAPGGEVGDPEEVHVSNVNDVEEILTLTKQAFQKAGIASCWDRVIAVVVQPGVEFYNDHVLNYVPDHAKKLSQYVEKLPNMVFEAHSTDYQNLESLKNLVNDHFMILKVGPALTFAYREGIFALETIERALAEWHSSWKKSDVSQIIDLEMRRNPANWLDHYPGFLPKQAFLRKYSYRDRIRYYWALQPVQESLQRLFGNLNSCEVPLPLISQYIPEQYEKIRSGELGMDPKSWVADKVFQVLEKYHQAVGGNCKRTNYDNIG